jgi:hypothetical protein
MEEQTRREEMRGGKQFYGAGATPSMGVSQFKGGRKMRKVVEFEPEEEMDDDEMRGGNVALDIAKLALRAAVSMGDTVAIAAARRAIRAAQSASTRLIGDIPDAVGTVTAKSPLAASYLSIFNKPSTTFQALSRGKRPTFFTSPTAPSSTPFDIDTFDVTGFNKLYLPKQPSAVGQMSLYKSPSSIGQYIDDVPTSITLPTIPTSAVTPSSAAAAALRRPSTVALTRPSSSALARRQSTSALSTPSTSAAARRQSAPALTTPSSAALTTSKEIAKTTDEVVEVLVQTVGAAATPKMAQTVSALAKSLAKSASSSAVRAGLKKLIAVGIPVAAAAVLIDFLVEKLTVKNRNQYRAEETIDEEGMDQEGMDEEERRRQIEEEERKREEEERKRQEEEEEEEEQPEEETIPSEIISSLPPDLSPNELAWYLRSGNLPDRYTFRKPTRARRGNGKCKVGGAFGLERRPDFGMIRRPDYGREIRPAVITPEDSFNSQLISKLFPPKSGIRSAVITREDMERSEELEKIRSGQRYREEMERRQKMFENIGMNKVPVVEVPKAPISKAPPKAPIGKPDGRKVRAQIVGKVMRERGLGLAQASKIVKAEGLY